MRLTLYTDYSLRVLLYLGSMDSDKLATIKEISESYGISKNHLMKVTHELGKLGYIETIRGRGGGIRLATETWRDRYWKSNTANGRRFLLSGLF